MAYGDILNIESATACVEKLCFRFVIIFFMYVLAIITEYFSIYLNIESTLSFT